MSSTSNWPKRLMNVGFEFVILGFAAIHIYALIAVWRNWDLDFNETFISTEALLTGFVAAIFVSLLNKVQKPTEEEIKIALKADADFKKLGRAKRLGAYLLGDPDRMRTALMIFTGFLYLAIAVAALVTTAIDTTTPDFMQTMGLVMLGALLPAIARVLGVDYTAE